MDLLKERKELSSQIGTLESKLSKINLQIRELIFNEVSTYLKENKVDNLPYTLESVTDGRMPNQIEIKLTHASEGSWKGHEPDEDFESDDAFKSLLTSLKEKYELSYIGVPYYYYPK